ncbi:hypothetical protein LIER_43660 [Lithospermum erythrorhizon]|uniref:Glyoxal oxidase N-terminal domain-containing protein n=1 Tax=Lithospermum erythrorhizon TaxID=34254 RepID=A0AAV3QHX3_LITER
MTQPTSLSLILWNVLLLLPFLQNVALSTGGKWNLLVPSIGISSMHMQLLNNDKVVMYDRTDFGISNISLPGTKRRIDPNFGPAGDCSAHSVEYDTGGTAEGDRVVRQYNPCKNGACDWTEIKDGLLMSRWYATNHILPDGKQIIVGGRGQFNYEFYPKVPSTDKIYRLPFLEQTNDLNIENNLYPFVFLNSDGNLFIFANNRAILLDYKTQVMLKNYPQIPGGDPRSYPRTGSAVLLSLKMLANDQVVIAEVLICGGAPKGSYVNALNGRFIGALASCARININSPNPEWNIETMPLARVMGDMVMLPNGDVLLINGASAGAARWELGRNLVLTPVVYKPDMPIGTRFKLQNPSKVPRMYHCTAALLRDGRILVGGSNPHNYYNFTGVLYPTELSLEAFSPSYLESEFAN